MSISHIYGILFKVSRLQDTFFEIFFFFNQELTVVQIKETKSMIDEQMKINDAELIKHEQERNEALKEVSNHLHESCIISNDEVQGLNC